MPATILVADDSPTEAKFAIAALQSAGYTVLTAVDGEDAIAQATANLPAVVVLDVVMPKKNGYQVCRHLKTTPATQNIKILLLTSKSQDSDKFWGLKQGADEYMTKPFAADQLVSRVAALV